MNTVKSFLDSIKEPFEPKGRRIDAMIESQVALTKNRNTPRPTKALLGALEYLRLHDPLHAEQLYVDVANHMTQGKRSRIEHTLHSKVRDDSSVGHAFMRLRYNYIAPYKPGEKCLLTESLKAHKADPVANLISFFEDCDLPIEGFAHCAIGATATLVDMGFLASSTSPNGTKACTTIFVNPCEDYRVVAITVMTEELSHDKNYLEQLKFLHRLAEKHKRITNDGHPS